MRSRRRGSPKRFRIGRVSVYPHHGAWWVYYRDAGQPVRQKVALVTRMPNRLPLKSIANWCPVPRYFSHSVPRRLPTCENLFSGIMSSS